MNEASTTLELPAALYAQLEALATESSTKPVQVIEQLGTAAQQRRHWQRDVFALRTQIEADGGLVIGSTNDELMERLRQTRRDIFDAEYAHL